MLPFTESEYERRLQALRGLMEQRSLEGVVLAEPASVNYYTGYDTLGFWNFQALLVSRDGERCIVTFFEEMPRVERIGCRAEGYAFGADPIEAVERGLSGMGISRGALGTEKSSRYLAPSVLEALSGRLSRLAFTDLGEEVVGLRLVKSPAESDYVREAAAITSQAMRAGLESLASGGLDRDTAIAMHDKAIGNGSEYFSIPPLVKFGPTMTEGHLTWRGIHLNAGDGVNLEIAAVRHRYHAPLLRCAFAGQPDAEIADAMDVALTGLEGALQAIRPGVTGHEVDAASVRAVEGTKYRFQPAGYSVGVSFPPSWMEAHLLAEGNQTPLERGMTLHVVPCVLIPGVAHVGASETVLVTDTGIEILTDLGRDMTLV